jgi:hypothetical protein
MGSKPATFPTCGHGPARPGMVASPPRTGPGPAIAPARPARPCPRCAARPARPAPGFPPGKSIKAPPESIPARGLPLAWTVCPGPACPTTPARPARPARLALARSFGHAAFTPGDCPGLPARFNRRARPIAPGLPARLVIFGGLIACGICPERRPVARVASGSSFRSKPVWRSPVPRNRPCRELSAPIVRPGPEGCHVQAGGLPVKCFWKIAHYRRFDFGGVSSCHTARSRLALPGDWKPGGNRREIRHQASPVAFVQKKGGRGMVENRSRGFLLRLQLVEW